MTSTRDRILDAVESISLRDGAVSITLEAVAAEAQVTKGGLLYHFSSKERLLLDTVARLKQRIHDQLNRVVDQGRSVAEWYLRATDEDEEDVLITCSVAAVMRMIDGQYPAVQEQVSELMRIVDHYILDELDDPVLAELVRLTGDGLRLTEIFGLDGSKPHLHRQLVVRLLG